MNIRERIKDQLELIQKNCQEAGAKITPKLHFSFQLALLEVYKRGGDDRVGHVDPPDPHPRRSTRPPARKR
jgi:hypothetical protein